jgi:hypothetical protein
LGSEKAKLGNRGLRNLACPKLKSSSQNIRILNEISFYLPNF